MRKLLSAPSAASIYPCSSCYLIQLLLLYIPAADTCSNWRCYYLSLHQLLSIQAAICYLFLHQLHLSMQQLLSIPKPATSYPCSCYLPIPAAPPSPPPKRKLDGRLEELAALTRMVNMEERASYIYNSDCLLRP
jgi:hypothetical protein